jgi:hypothetical protein
MDHELMKKDDDVTVVDLPRVSLSWKKPPKRKGDLYDLDTL